jgi:hypothetical protein
MSSPPSAIPVILLLTLYVDFEVKFRGFFPYLVLKVKLLALLHLLSEKDSKQ